MSETTQNFVQAEPVQIDLGEQGNVAGDELRSFVERVENLETEKKTISDDIKDVYGEAGSRGYDVKVLRKIVALRKQDADERAEMDAILELYLNALGEA